MAFRKARETLDELGASWVIDGVTDPQAFFVGLKLAFPEADLFFVEGTSIDSEVRVVYEEHRSEGPYVPGRQTLFPRSRTFRCHATAELFSSLSSLAERHATPELLDHLFLFSGTVCLVYWHDAFANSLFVHDSVGEARVAAFAKGLGARYSHE